MPVGRLGVTLACLLRGDAARIVTGIVLAWGCGDTKPGTKLSDSAYLSIVPQSISHVRTEYKAQRDPGSI